MKILITGCAGFFASKVVELLLKTNNKVIGTDNLNNVCDIKLKEWRLEHINKNGRIAKERMIRL